MKKLLTGLLIAILLVSCVSLAEESTTNVPSTFDYTVFEGLDGFVFDDNDDSWLYAGVCYDKYGDKDISIAISASGDKEGSISVDITCIVSSESKPDTFLPVKGLVIFADYNAIICQMLNFSGEFINMPRTYVLPESIEALDMITKANMRAFNIYLSGDDDFLIMPSKTELSEFLEVARNIYESNVVNYTDPSKADAARYFGCYAIIDENVL